MALCLYFDDFTLHFRSTKSPTATLKASHEFQFDPAKLSFSECRTEDERECMRVLQEHIIMDNLRQQKRCGIEASFTIIRSSGSASIINPPRIELAMKGSILSEFVGHQSPMKVAAFRMDLLDLKGTFLDMGSRGFKESIRNDCWVICQDLQNVIWSKGGFKNEEKYDAILQIWVKPS